MVGMGLGEQVTGLLGQVEGSAEVIQCLAMPTRKCAGPTERSAHQLDSGPITVMFCGHQSSSPGIEPDLQVALSVVEGVQDPR
jgi:hypothetical protein